MRIHLVLFVLGGIVVAVVDWAQGADTTSRVFGLDWAHVLIVVWIPIIVVHVVSSWWGGEVDDLDDDTMRSIRGRWFGGYTED